MSEQLIDRLCADLQPVRPGGVARRLAVGVGAGVLFSTLLMLVLLGPRPDMARASAAAMFWIKAAYTLAFAGIGLWAAERLSRPAGEARHWVAWFVAPLAVMAVLALARLAAAPAPMRMPLILGHSAAVCPWYILTLSAAPFAGLVWAMRGLAPTRLRLAGAVAGLAAGGAGAAVYAIHCTEDAAPFLVTWYALAVVAAGLVGALLGPIVLRWR